MTTAQISLPKGVGPHAEKLFDAITQASTAEDLNRAGGKAEGFVLGLETAKAIRIILMDDYGLPIHIHQKLAFDKFAASVDHEILCLPTGQGLLIKTH